MRRDAGVAVAIDTAAPNDIGQACLFLGSDAATYLNGATIWSDGEGI